MVVGPPWHLRTAHVSGTERAGPSVCVIGAGAIGLSCALELVRRGAGKVTILESRELASGSSGRSAGIIETQYLDPLDIELRARSMRWFERFEREHGLRVQRIGYLRLGHSPDSPREFARSVEVQRALGVTGSRVLDREQVGRLVPDMRVDDVVAGLFGARDGFIDAHDYCELMAELALGAGAKLLVGHELLGACRRGQGELRLRTSGGMLDCDLAVDAAGAWAGSVAGLLGYELDVLAQRRQAAVVPLTRELPYVMPSVMDYTPGAGEPGLYFRHDAPGRLLAGLHSEEASERSVDPDDYVPTADEGFMRTLAVMLKSRLPALPIGPWRAGDSSVECPASVAGDSYAEGPASLAGGWAGLYPASPTGRALVGPIAPGAPVIVAGGAGGSGIQLAPVLGELAADWVLHGEPRAVSRARELTPGA
jgi:sarcosine oxidase subunit beta